MKSLKRSAIIFTISIAGFLAIRATGTQSVIFSGQSFTLEELAWQSVPRETASASQALGSVEQRPDISALMTTMQLAGASKCTFKCVPASNR